MADGDLRVGPGFYRAHGLGNDYLVFEGARSDESALSLTAAAVRAICRRGEGEGADGIVVLLERDPDDGIYPLRMFNPDGSEFERSGNGLRVLASWLGREGLVGRGPFRVRSGGTEIPMEIHPGAPPGVHDVSVGLGEAGVGTGALPVIRDRLDPAGRAVHPEIGPVALTPVWVGNPHVVIFRDALGQEEGGADGALPDLADLADRLGPFLTRHPAFPDGVNVQIAEITAPGGLEIAIWERGVGPTPASGTSSCAAAVAAVHAGRIEAGSLEVAMPGGTLRVEVTAALNVTLRGPVAEVATGRLTDGFVATLAAATS